MVGIIHRRYQIQIKIAKKQLDYVNFKTIKKYEGNVEACIVDAWVRFTTARWRGSDKCNYHNSMKYTLSLSASAPV